MSTTLRYREALNEALREEMDRDQRVLVIGEDVGTFGGAFRVTEGLLEAYGERRVRDAQTAPAALVGLGVGAALAGLRPVVELMTADLAFQALDQVANSVASARSASGGQFAVPLVLRMPQGTGNQLGAAHSHCLEALFLHLPGLLVVTPATPADAKGLLKTAIRDDNPVVFIEHAALYDVPGEVPKDQQLVPFGVAAVRRPGHDITLLGISRMAQTALAAADLLEREHGISAEVIDPRSLRPLDLDTIVASVRRTNRLVVVEEGWPQGGVSATIAAAVQESAFDHLDAPVLRVTGADTPMPYAQSLERAASPDARAVAQAALASLGRA